MPSSVTSRPWFPVAIAIALLLAIGMSTFTYKVPDAHSQTSGVPITGYAWSDNTGWISLNCQNDNSCATSNYGLTLQNSTNLITGYAWSDNLGWIKFGGLSGFPTGSGTTASDATLLSNGTVSGWARACAGTSAGDCSTMTSRTDGWDGWISLSGTSYGVTTVANPTYNGNWAWDGDVNGWLAFNMAFPSCTPLGPVCATDTNGQQMSSSTSQYCQSVVVDPCQYGCSAGSCMPGTGDAGWLSLSQTSVVRSKRVAPGSTATLYWYVPGVTSCTITGSNGDSWNLTVVSGTTQGSKVTSAIQSARTYKLNCTDTNGSNWNGAASSIVNITTAPQFKEI